MIERIYLRNFQRWDVLKLVLDQVTTIVGPSDTGKTAIIRALYWLCFGRPLGKEFIQHGTDRCRVGVVLDGQSVVRIRHIGGRQQYRIDNQVLRAFGTTVPEQVQLLLNLTEVNFQQQLDPPFWLLDSPGQLSKNLNSIVNLGLIDNVQASVRKQVLVARTNLTACEDRLATHKKQASSLKWVETCHVELQQIERLSEQLSELQARSTRLDHILHATLPLLRRRSRLLGAISGASRLLTTAREYRQTVARANRLSVILNRITHLREIARVEVDAMLLSLKEMNSKRLQLNEARQRASKLSKLLTRVEASETLLASKSKAYKQVETQLLSVERCPLCRNPLS